MRTEEEVGRAIGAQLRAEVADIEARPDLLGAIRRRRARKSMMTTAAVNVAAVAVVAGAGTVLAMAPGLLASHRHPVRQATAHTSVQLDGYLISMPAGTHVRRLGAGYLVTKHSGGFLIYLQSELMVVPGSGGLVLQVVPIGNTTGTWSGNSTAGELRARIPGLPGTEYLVAKDYGVPEAAVLHFAAGLSASKMPAVRVGCVHGCG